MKFAILHNEEIFKSNYPLDYRLVIMRAAFSWISNNKDEDKAKIKDFICKAKDYISFLGNNENDHMYKEGFIGLYTFTKKGKPGVLLVDRSGGCYPLVGYPDDDEQANKGNRVSGMQMVFEDLCNCFDKVVEYYSEDFEKNWESIKTELVEKFNYKT